MEIAELVLRYVDVLLDWPLLTFILVFLALLWLRQPLAGLISRVGSVEGYGIRVKTLDPAEQQREAEQGLETKSSDALVEFIQSNPEEVAQYHQRLANGYWFERALNLIFGSQLDLLEHLEAKGDMGEKYVNLHSFFQEFLRRGGFPTTQMADYLGFLVTSRFMEYHTHNGEQCARITPFGADFLSYLRAQYPAGYQHKPL